MTPEVQAAVEMLEKQAVINAEVFSLKASDIRFIIQALRDAERLLADARKQGQVEALEWAGYKMAAENVKCGELVIGKGE